MADITLKGNAIHTNGDLPGEGATVPGFELVRQDLSTASLDTYAGKKKILNIFPSIDTAVCALSVKSFHGKASSLQDVVVLNISADLPFAQKRFCGSEGVDNAETLSTFRSDFAEQYGVKILDGPLAGLCARAVLVLDSANKVLHSQLVPEIAQEPDYAAALAVVS
ncbi:MAG: thiol peroxidase [Planctomycetota bacterium]